MPATARQTRKQIRQSIGMQMGAVNLDAGSVTHSPSETAPSAAKLIDQALSFGGNDEHRGKWLVATDSNSSVYIRRVSGSSPDERSLTVSVPFDRAPDTGWTYELWDEDVSPVLVHQYINDALTEVTRKGCIGVTLDSFHTGGRVLSWGTDSSLLGVRDVWWRRSYIGQQLLSFDEAMSSGSGVTVSNDSEDVKEGVSAIRLGVPAAMSTAADVAISSFNAIDVSGYTHVELWMKATLITTSSNYRLQLLNGSSVRESLALPALSPDSWTRVSIPLANAWSATAISRVTVRTGSSAGSSNRIFFDDLVAYRAGTEEWAHVPRDFWTVDRDNRKLELKKEAPVPYAKLRVSAVRSPSQLTADSDVSGIDPQYVVHSALAKMLRKTADRRGQNVDAAFRQADYHEKLAQAMRLRWSLPGGVRWLDD